MSFNYRTVVDGRGYRFTLPSLGLPDPKGSWAVVQVATSKNDLDFINVPPKPADGSLPEMRFITGEQKIKPVTHNGAVWLLPIIDIESEEDPYFCAIRVKRTLAPDSAGEPKTSKVKASKTKKAARPSTTVQHTPLPGATKLRARENMSIDQPGSLRHIMAEAERERDKKNPDKHKGHKRLGVPIALPGNGPMACCVDCIRVKGASRGNFLLEPDVHAEIQMDSNYGLRWMVYVDQLPKGDRVPERLINHESYHTEDAPWAIERRQRTFYHQAKTPPKLRTKFWSSLTGKGLRCDIQGGRLFVDFALRKPYYFEVKPPTRLVSGSALLKVVEKPEDYDCQPCAASTEASYFLHRYQLLVGQRGRQQPAIEPLARYIDGGEDSVLSMLGQYAMLEGQDGSSEKMVFCSVAGPMPIQGLDDLQNVGVRLRHGGARFPISSDSHIKMPGSALHSALFGDYRERRKIRSEDDAEVGLKHERHARFRAQCSAGQQDIVLRVVDHSRGMYGELEYAFRESGSFEPVREGEWKAFGTPMVEQWVVYFFLNMARQSYGRHEDDDFAGLHRDEEDEG